jgi:hypothetical protein
MPLEVEILCLRVLIDFELGEAERAKVRDGQLNLISEKKGNCDFSSPTLLEKNG